MSELQTAAVIVGLDRASRAPIWGQCGSGELLTLVLRDLFKHFSSSISISTSMFPLARFVVIPMR